MDETASEPNASDRPNGPRVRRVTQLVVIGASVGGVEPLTDLVRGLPADLPAAIFVAMHVPP